MTDAAVESALATGKGGEWLVSVPRYGGQWAEVGAKPTRG